MTAVALPNSLTSSRRPAWASISRDQCRRPPVLKMVRLLQAPAILLVCAAVMGTLVCLAGHAPFAPQFILPEVVMPVLLVAATRARADEAGETPQVGRP